MRLKKCYINFVKDISKIIIMQAPSLLLLCTYDVVTDGTFYVKSIQFDKDEFRSIKIKKKKRRQF